jgi:hypothetical protein
MADVTLARQSINVNGLLNAQTAIDATDDYHFVFDNRTYLHIVNGAGSISVVTFFITQAGRGGTVIQDEVVNVPATDEMKIGPFPDVYGALAGPSPGLVHFQQDQASSVTAGVFRV